MEVKWEESPADILLMNHLTKWRDQIAGKSVKVPFVKFYVVLGLPEKRDIRILIKDDPKCSKVLYVRSTSNYSSTSFNQMFSAIKRMLSLYPANSVHTIIVEYADESVICGGEMGVFASGMRSFPTKKRMSTIEFDYPNIQVDDTLENEIAVDVTFTPKVAVDTVTISTTIEGTQDDSPAN